MKPSLYGELMLLSGNGNRELSERIARTLDLPLAPLEVGHFADGETNVKISESVRGYDVFLIQPTCAPVNENLMEMFLVLDGLRRASASRITTVIPYYGYQRKEKKTQPRDPISAKLVANFIELAGADRAMLIDVHAEAIQGFFDIPVDLLTAGKILAQHVQKRYPDEALTVVSPDAGGAQRARTMARLLNAPMAMIDKRRPNDDVTEVVSVVGDVDGKTCVIIDDLISTGSTLVNAAVALKEHGAARVSVVATHAVFAPGTLARLHEAPIDEICVTDTIPLSASFRNPDDYPRLRILTVAPLLAEAIVRVHEGRSVSELLR